MKGLIIIYIVLLSISTLVRSQTLNIDSAFNCTSEIVKDTVVKTWIDSKNVEHKIFYPRNTKIYFISHRNYKDSIDYPKDESIVLYSGNLKRGKYNAVLTFTYYSFDEEINLVIFLKNKSYKPKLFYYAMPGNYDEQLKIKKVKLLLNKINFANNETVRGHIWLSYYGKYPDLETAGKTDIWGEIDGDFTLQVN